MKKAIVFVVLVSFVLLLGSCSRRISVEQAANGRARCGNHL